MHVVMVPSARLAFSALVVRVVMAQPGARFVAPLRRPVEPLVHAPEAVQSARIGELLNAT